MTPALFFVIFLFNQSHTFSKVIIQPVGELLLRSTSHVRHFTAVTRRPLFLPNIILKIRI